MGFIPCGMEVRLHNHLYTPATRHLLYVICISYVCCVKAAILFSPNPSQYDEDLICIIASLISLEQGAVVCYVFHRNKMSMRTDSVTKTNLTQAYCDMTCFQY
jgi:hypothetical protein